MDDLISRQAAIDAFLIELTKRERKNFLHTWSTVEVKYFVADMLEKLPPAQPGWIPCSTALPKDEEEVIVSIHDDSGDYACDYTSSGWYAAAGEFWVVDNEASMRVVAWMPLPTPYREGGQDERSD